MRESSALLANLRRQRRRGARRMARPRSRGSFGPERVRPSVSSGHSSISSMVSSSSNFRPMLFVRDSSAADQRCRLPMISDSGSTASRRSRQISLSSAIGASSGSSTASSAISASVSDSAQLARRSPAGRESRLLRLHPAAGCWSACILRETRRAARRNRLRRRSGAMGRASTAGT